MTIQDEVNKANTKAFINNNPVQVTLTPYAKIQQPSGGFKLMPQTARPVQTFTKVNPSLRGTTLEVTTEDGHVIIPEFTLVGYADAAIEVNDRFVLQGKTYKVELVEPSRDNWAKRAIVTRWTN